MLYNVHHTFDFKSTKNELFLYFKKYKDLNEKKYSTKAVQFYATNSYVYNETYLQRADPLYCLIITKSLFKVIKNCFITAKFQTVLEIVTKV